MSDYKLSDKAKIDIEQCIGEGGSIHSIGNELDGEDGCALYILDFGLVKQIMYDTGLDHVNIQIGRKEVEFLINNLDQSTQ